MKGTSTSETPWDPRLRIILLPSKCYPPRRSPPVKPLNAPDTRFQHTLRIHYQHGSKHCYTVPMSNCHWTGRTDYGQIVQPARMFLVRQISYRPVLLKGWMIFRWYWHNKQHTEKPCHLIGGGAFTFRGTNAERTEEAIPESWPIEGETKREDTITDRRRQSPISIYITI